MYSFNQNNARFHPGSFSGIFIQGTRLSLSEGIVPTSAPEKEIKKLQGEIRQLSGIKNEFNQIHISIYYNMITV